MNKTKILGIVGSTRKASINRVLIDNFSKLLLENEGVSFELVEINNLPLFNQDMEANYPKEAEDFKNKIKEADGILIATPEHNRSIPAALKNAIDWSSRPFGTNAWAGKKALIMGATGGIVGTSLAQYHLKQILSYLDARVLGQPEIYVGNFKDKFNEAGELTDQKSKEFFVKAITTFLKFIAE